MWHFMRILLRERGKECVASEPRGLTPPWVTAADNTGNMLSMWFGWGVLSLSALPGVWLAAPWLLPRIWFELFVPLGFGAAGEVLALLGMAAILWGSLQALRQQRIKPLVAWSTVAQLGYMFLVFAIATGLSWSATLLHLTAHALAKAALFLAAGNIVLALGDDRLSSLRGASHGMPLTFFTVGLAGVSLMGLPPTGGFVAKWLLLQAAIDQEHWLAVVVILAGSLLAAAYLFPLLRHALTGTLKQTGEGAGRSLPLQLELPPLLLALLALLLGVLASWPLALLRPAMPLVLS